ncbi:MAG: MBL fold metallo-hydrolase [Bacteroidales bacterium]|nr:MBL fold metallo-hydrolase [Bacteroidales bacterium]
MIYLLMELYSIIAENWKMDGGAVFGVVPKTIWKKNYPADEKNNVPVKSRCLLVNHDDRKILIDTGMGRKQNEKYYHYKYLTHKDELVRNLRDKGFEPDEITDVLFTHLHDDHVGGAVYLANNGKYKMTFPNARHYVSREQYVWAVNPNLREAASYFKENFEPIKDADQLIFLERKDQSPFDGIELRFFDGHTRGQIIPIVNTEDKKIVFAADFIPSVAHIPIPYIASVDIEPLKALVEKEHFINEALDNQYILFFEHDSFYECCTLKQTKKGIRADQILTLEQLRLN